MQAIIDWFKSIASSFLACLKWIYFVPSVLTISVVTIAGIIQRQISAFTKPVPELQSSLSAASESLDAIASSSDTIPDMIKIALYCLSLDTLFDFIISCLGYFIELTTIFIVLFLSIINALLSLLVIKWTAKLICAFLPANYCPHILTTLANLNLPIGRLYRSIVRIAIKGSFKL